MSCFLEQHQDKIGCLLSCFDRVVITGALPDICHANAKHLAGGTLLQIELIRKLKGVSKGESGSLDPRRAL